MKGWIALGLFFSIVHVGVGQESIGVDALVNRLSGLGGKDLELKVVSRDLFELSTEQLAGAKEQLTELAAKPDMAAAHPVLETVLGSLSENPVGYADRLAASGRGADLISGLSEGATPGMIDAYLPFVQKWLPGGVKSFGASVDLQRKAMKLASRGSKLDDVFSRLSRVIDLGSPLKDDALEAMRQVPEDQWPKGFDRFTEGGAQKEAAAAVPPEVMKLGKEVYMKAGSCTTCHQPNGKGLPSVFPPINQSPWLDDDTRMVKIINNGLMGALELNGEMYNNVMVAQGLLLKDEELAAVISYVKEVYGKGGLVTPDFVKEVKASIDPGQTFWTVEQILKDHPLGE
ncbi:MAG: cytochrome c [Verrucomicrobiota bacterium]